MMAMKSYKSSNNTTKQIYEEITNMASHPYSIISSRHNLKEELTSLGIMTHHKNGDMRSLEDIIRDLGKVVEGNER